MKSNTFPLLEAAQLEDMIGSAHLVVVNAGGGPAAKAAYDQKHLLGALYVALDKDLSDIKPNAANGGRHPLPTPESFGKTLSRLGITPQSHVVIYDDKGGANAAARFWWMLRSIGHREAYVLNGGLQAAQHQGLPMSSTPAKPKAAPPYPTEGWQWPVSIIQKVATAAADPRAVVIDVREAYRYLGESEPIDLVAGHIPGAINIPLQENLDEKGMFLSPAELRAKYEPVLKQRQAIIHCGSGVTACHTILALASAGFEIPSLYVGSWSEWSRNDGTFPIGIGTQSP